MLKLQFSGPAGTFSGLRLLNDMLSQIVAFAGLLLIFYYSSILFWQFSYPEEFKVPISSQPQNKPRVVARGSWRWFQDTAFTKVPAQRKESKLQAKLVGVIAQGEEGEGIALISVKKKNAKIFHVGDEIAPVVFLKSVGAYYVNLERDGQIEVLEMKRANLFKGEKPDKPPATEEQNPTQSAAKAQFKRILKKKPLKIAEFANFERSGEGFAISPKNDEHQALFDELGLIGGDVVVSANGKKIAELITNPKAWKTITNSEEIVIQVMRDGIITDVIID